MRALTGIVMGAAILLNAACQEPKNEESIIHVTNGAAIDNDEYPAVVRISLGNSSCTASFLSEDVLLTAAHCVRNKTFPKEIRVLAHPLYATSSANRVDLALIKFSDKKSAHHLQISSRPPKAKEKITIVGFGLSDAQDKTTAGVKRKGNNVLGSRENGLLMFSGVVRGSAEDGKESASASGDSGGPMLLDGQQVGVTSAGVVKGDTKFSIYVDLHSEDSKEFFRQAQDADFKIPLPAGFL